jgi:hypothetical protein
VRQSLTMKKATDPERPRARESGELLGVSRQRSSSSSAPSGSPRLTPSTTSGRCGTGRRSRRGPSSTGGASTAGAQLAQGTGEPMTDVVTGAIIGAAAVVVGGIGAGVIDLIARRQDRSHDTTERAAEREAGASARREEREAVERAAWRERAAVTFGQVLEFATDVQPANSTALIQTAEEAQAKFERLEVRWEALRAPLGVLIIGLPTTAERDLAEDVF